MRHTIMQVVAVASLYLMASVLAARAQPPDATLEVHIVSIALGAGYSWGGGIVTFRGTLLLDSGVLRSCVVREG
jgi:hypothetical protein